MIHGNLHLSTPILYTYFFLPISLFLSHHINYKLITFTLSKYILSVFSLFGTMKVCMNHYSFIKYWSMYRKLREADINCLSLQSSLSPLMSCDEELFTVLCDVLCRGFWITKNPWIGEKLIFFPMVYYYKSNFSNQNY